MAHNDVNNLLNAGIKNNNESMVMSIVFVVGRSKTIQLVKLTMMGTNQLHVGWKGILGMQ